MALRLLDTLLVCLLNVQMHEDAPCQIGLVATWSGDLWGVRREVLPWITYHAQLGVSRVYMLYDGSDQNTLTVGWLVARHIQPSAASQPVAQGAGRLQVARMWCPCIQTPADAAMQGLLHGTT